MALEKPTGRSKCVAPTRTSQRPHVLLRAREDASLPLVGADQNFDSAVALCAPLDGVIAIGLLRYERPRLDPVGRHTGPDQRVTICGAVDPETHGRILPRIGRDLGGLVQLGRPNVGPVVVEREVPERRPARARISRNACTGYSGR